MLGRGGGDICADCSAPGPQWASLNRGIVICDDCCSVHRSLGRHISQVRPIQSSMMYWPPSLQEMFENLVSKGANSIWEHSLKDSRVGTRKPNPKDKIDRVKSKFIQAKHSKLAFMNRPPVKDSDENAILDLSYQLHASVRGNNLETVLRFLALGAKPNFQHPERGNMPLHVAASAGQQLQCELLVVYGANPCALDSRGHTPVECARIAGYHETADRLIECQYELTDRLASYVCGRRPVHVSGEHHILPALPGSTDVSEHAIEARYRLRNLSNSFFEELAADVYDEVDRRETEQVWLETHQSVVMGTGQVSIPFLPFNSSYSATRFQGRQKLATFNSRDFATLIIDILTDAKRRQMESMEKSTVEGNLVPIDGLEVIQQQHLEEMREMQRQHEKEAAASTDGAGMDPANRNDHNEVDGPSDGGETPMNSKSPPGHDIYDQVQHDYDEVSFEAGKIKFSSVEKQKNKANRDVPDGSSPDKPPVAPKPSMKLARTRDAEVQTPLPALMELDGPQSGASQDTPSTSSAKTSDNASSADTKDRVLKEAEYRIEQLLQLNSGMGEEIRLLQAMVQKLMQENSMLRTMQQGRGSISSNMSGTSSPRAQQDMYTTHHSLSQSGFAAASAAASLSQKTGGGGGGGGHRFVSSKSVPEPFTKPITPFAKSSSLAEPPPIPEKKLPRRQHGQGERSLSTSAVVNSPTSPTSPGAVFHPSGTQFPATTSSSAAAASSGLAMTDVTRQTDDTPQRSPQTGRASPTVAPRHHGGGSGRGSPLAASRSSPIARNGQDKERGDSPKDDQPRSTTVNGSPTTAPKEPPKLPPKKRRAQSVYDVGASATAGGGGGGAGNGGGGGTSMATPTGSSTLNYHRASTFDVASADDKTRIAATLGSSNGLGRSSLIISPGAKNSSTSNAPRSNAINRYTNEQSGYTSGGSPAMRRPPKTSLTSTGSTSTSDGTSVDGGGGNSTGTNRGKKTKEQDLVVQQTEQITKRIQDLLRTAKSQELTKFIACSRKIAAAVNDMAALFPNRPDSDSVRMSLASLVSSAARLKEECRVGNQLSITIRRDNSGKIVPADEEKVRTVTQQVIQCAYDIARAARELVQHVEETLLRGGTDPDSSN